MKCVCLCVAVLALAGCRAPEPMAGGSASMGSASSTGSSGTAGASGSAGSSTSSGTTTLGPESTQTTCETMCETGIIESGCDEAEADGFDGFDGATTGGYDDSDEGGGSAGGEDTGIGMGGDPPLVSSVFAIQQGVVRQGTWVSVPGVVATSPPVPGPNGIGSMFTVSDPSGGPYSGITVRVDAEPSEVPVEPGLMLTIFADLEASKLTNQLATNPYWIADEGQGVQPPPLELDLEILQGIAEGTVDVQPYDSVLVSLPASTAQDADCDGELQLAYAGLRVDDRFLRAVGIDLPDAAMFDEVGGTFLLTLNGFEVAPRTLAELGL